MKRSARKRAPPTHTGVGLNNTVENNQSGSTQSHTNNTVATSDDIVAPPTKRVRSQIRSKVQARQACVQSVTSNSHTSRPATTQTVEQTVGQCEQNNTLDPDNVSTDDESESDMGLGTTVTAHTSDIVGGNGVFHEPLSTSLPTLVPDSVKQQIWSNKYVDLASLLPSNITSYNQQGTFTFQMDKFSNISLVPKQQTKKITSIELWTTAFLRYVAIYSQHYPFETPALMKYAEIVRDLASKRPGTAFSNYDTQFRRLRETVMFPWDRIHMELWLLATTQPTVPAASLFRPYKSQPFTPQFRPHKKQRSKFLPNTCWTFNRGNRCTNPNCPHPHICGLCREPHAANACNNTTRNQPPQSQGPASTHSTTRTKTLRH